MLYAVVKVTDADNLDVWYNDAKIHSYNVSRQQYITPIGEYKTGEMVTLRVEMKEDNKSGTAQVYVYQLNQDVLLSGYQKLQNGKLQLTEFNDTSFKGTVNATESSALYLSVPYEKGWTVYVDGKKSRLYPIFDAMCGVNVDPGEHEIEMRYSPRGFVPGMCISISCLAILIGLYLLERKKRGNHAVFSPEPVSVPSGAAADTAADTLAAVRSDESSDVSADMPADIVSDEVSDDADSDDAASDDMEEA